MRTTGTIRALLAAFVVAALAGCASQAGFSGASAPTEFHDVIANNALEPVLGYRFQREPTAEALFETAGENALVTDGRFYSIRRDAAIEGSLQVSRFKSEVDGSDRAIHSQVERSLGGSFTNRRIGSARIRERVKRQQRLFLWFPPERNVMVLLVSRNDFDDADRVVAGVVSQLRRLDGDRILAALPDLGPRPSGPVPPGQLQSAPIQLTPVIPDRSGAPAVTQPERAPASPSGRPAPQPGAVSGPIFVPPDLSDPSAPPPERCPDPTFIEADDQTVRHPAMTVIPPGGAAEGTRVEVRVQVTNALSRSQRLRVKVYADTVAEGSLLGSDTVQLPAGGSGLVTIWFDSDGRLGLRRLLSVVSSTEAGGAPSVEMVETYEINPTRFRSEPQFRLVWLDPLGLSAGVYSRDCPITEAGLRAYVDALDGVGVRGIVLTYAEFFGSFFYPSRLSFPDRDTGGTVKGELFDYDVYGTVIDQADRHGMAVFLGIGRQGDTQLSNSTRSDDFEERLADALAIGKDVTDELWSLYGNHDSFYGWYLTHETNSLPGINRFYDGMSRYVEKFGPDKPTMIAPAGAPQFTRRQIETSEVDVFAYQDAVGAGYDGRNYTYDPEVAIASIKRRYSSYVELHEGTDTHLWSDTELWEMDGTQGYAGAYPAKFSRVRRQLEAAAPYVDVLTAYDITGFLDIPGHPQQLDDERALALFVAYDSYRKGRG